MALRLAAAASAAALLVTIGGAFAVLGHSGPQPHLDASRPRLTGNEDLRCCGSASGSKLTAVFQANEVKVVHPKGAPSRPAGGPVRNVLPGHE